MTYQDPSQPQAVPTTPSPAPTAQQAPAQGAGAPPGAATAPQAPQPAPTQTPDAVRAQLEAEVRRLRGAQAAADRRAYEIQRQAEQQQAALRAQEQQAQLQQLPDGQREVVEKQILQQALAEERQRNADLQWRQYLQGLAAEHAAQGIPYQVMIDATANAPDPMQAAQAMNIAAAQYWRNIALGQGQQPQPYQPPVQQPYGQQPTQYAQPTQAPQPVVQQRPVPPPITTHATAAQTPYLDEQADALREKTAKTKESTVFEALQVIRERQRQAQGGGT